MNDSFQPELEELEHQIPNKYAMVIAVARRSRMINQGEGPLINKHRRKAVSLALEELAEGKLEWQVSDEVQ